jgi:ribonuclease J
MGHNSNQDVKLSALGGLGEIGLNMLVLECAGQALVIDAGLSFPQERVLGIETIVPRLTYLERAAPEILGLILTHGHEDHIGAVPFLLNRFNAPIYGDELALGFLRRRLVERAITADLHRVVPYQRLELGPFALEFIPVTHSVPGSFALAIETPAGLIVHSGDFKIDDSPVDGRPFDRGAFGKLGERGVTLLLSDSTNAEQPGRTPSESSLRSVLKELVARAKGKVFLSIFSSHLYRIKQLAEASRDSGRSMAALGRRMAESLRLGLEFGHLDEVAGTLVDTEEAAFYPPHRIAYLAAGSQGEPLSAMVKIAHDSHPYVRIQPGDMVLLSSRFIPGNERAIHALINQLFRRGADVYYETVAPVHVSGHASREELAELLTLTRPRYFVPIHGEYRHLLRHRALAIECGVAEENALLLENGDSITMSAGKLARGGRVESGRLMVCGGEPIDDALLKQRQALARHGALVLVLAVSRATGKVVAGPDILSQGLTLGDGSSMPIQAARAEVASRLAGMDTRLRTSTDQLKAELERTLRSYLRSQLGQSPVVMSCVVEV